MLVAVVQVKYSWGWRKTPIKHADEVFGVTAGYMLRYFYYYYFYFY